VVTCDDPSQPVPFVVEKLHIDLARLKVVADRRAPGTSPIYFKSRYLLRDQPDLGEQAEFESKLWSTGLFNDGRPEPKWPEVQAALRDENEANSASAR
jgi:hypothetical protein